MENMALPIVLLFIHMCSSWAETGGSCKGALEAGRWQRQEIKGVMSSGRKGSQFNRPEC